MMHVQKETPVTTVLVWQEAVNGKDVERLLSLSAPDIEIVGPRGTGNGHQVLREWVAGAGLVLTTQRVFGRDSDVVLEQHGTWISTETGEMMGEADIASRFRVCEGRVVGLTRYDELDRALADAGLTYDDEVSS